MSGTATATATRTAPAAEVSRPAPGAAVPAPAAEPVSNQQALRFVPADTGPSTTALDRLRSVTTPQVRAAIAVLTAASGDSDLAVVAALSAWQAARSLTPPKPGYLEATTLRELVLALVDAGQPLAAVHLVLNYYGAPPAPVIMGGPACGHARHADAAAVTTPRLSPVAGDATGIIDLCPSLVLPTTADPAPYAVFVHTLLHESTHVVQFGDPETLMDPADETRRNLHEFWAYYGEVLPTGDVPRLGSTALIEAAQACLKAADAIPMPSRSGDLLTAYDQVLVVLQYATIHDLQVQDLPADDLVRRRGAAAALAVGVYEALPAPSRTPALQRLHRELLPVARSQGRRACPPGAAP